MLPQECGTHMLVLLVLLCNLLLVASQSTLNLESLVNDVFSKRFVPTLAPVPADNSASHQQLGSATGPSQCNCVPYRLCEPTAKDGTTFDGYGEIDLRSIDKNSSCPLIVDACCSGGGGHTNTASIMETSMMGQCSCVSYHLCEPDGDSDGDVSFDGSGKIDLRFDDDNPTCSHYLDVCCNNNRIRTESATTRPVVEQPNRPRGCGIRNVGGIDFNLSGTKDNEAGFGEFPWTVALLNVKHIYFCAGSLIHPQVVLTAVHCIIDRPASSMMVRAGEWDSQTEKERLPFVERNVQHVIVHPQYNKRNAANDFALLFLSEPIELNDHINVICLPGPNATPAPRTTCFSTGWGKDKFGASGRWSTIMKRVPLPVVEFSECQTRLRGTRLGPRFALDRSFMCAGGERDVDTCEGDGGAPLVCPIGLAAESRYIQSGIVAWGIGCNDEIPAAYANVALARNWIDEQMLANGFDITSYSAY